MGVFSTHHLVSNRYLALLLPRGFCPFFGWLAGFGWLRSQVVAVTKVIKGRLWYGPRGNGRLFTLRPSIPLDWSTLLSTRATALSSWFSLPGLTHIHSTRAPLKDRWNMNNGMEGVWKDDLQTVMDGQAHWSVDDLGHTSCTHSIQSRPCTSFSSARLSSVLGSSDPGGQLELGEPGLFFNVLPTIDRPREVTDSRWRALLFTADGRGSVMIDNRNRQGSEDSQHFAAQ